jgi:hypothetical protein
MMMMVSGDDETDAYHGCLAHKDCRFHNQTKTEQKPRHGGEMNPSKNKKQSYKIPNVEERALLPSFLFVISPKDFQIQTPFVFGGLRGYGGTKKKKELRKS